MFKALTSTPFRLACRSVKASFKPSNAASTTPAVMANQFQFQLRTFADEPSAVNTGHVKWFDTKKGFGFIIPEDGSPDVFVHQTSIHAEGFRSLAEGESVEFEIEEDDNGRRFAMGVTGPDGAYVQGAPRRNGYGDDDNEFKDY